MKTLKLLSLILMTTFVSVILMRCSEDDPQPIPDYDLSGQVTFTDGAAGGAIVYLAESATPTTTYSQSTITDENGNYSFKDLDAGDYFLYSNFNTKNTNLEDARLGGMIFVSGDDNLVTIVDANVTQNIVLGNSGSTGADVDTYDETSGWTSDKTHSSVYFEFPYDEVNSNFEGHFDQFDIDVKVDENDLAGSKIEAWVDVTTIKTTQPGRDGVWTDYGTETEAYDAGCIAVSFKASTGTHENTVLVPDNRYATWATTSIERYGDGFKAKGNFTFAGTTQEETLLLKYNPGFVDTNNNRVLASFEGELTFKPLDYAVESGHLGEAEVTLSISAQLRQAL